MTSNSNSRNSADHLRLVSVLFNSFMMKTDRPDPGSASPTHTRGTQSDHRLNNMTDTDMTKRWERETQRRKRRRKRGDLPFTSELDYKTEATVMESGCLLSAPSWQDSVCTQAQMQANTYWTHLPGAYRLLDNSLYVTSAFQKVAVPWSEVSAWEGLECGGGGALRLFLLRDDSVDETRLRTPWTHRVFVVNFQFG